MFSEIHETLSRRAGGSVYCGLPGQRAAEMFSSGPANFPTWKGVTPMFRIVNWRAGDRSARRLDRVGSACVEALEDRRLLAGYQVEALEGLRTGDDLAGGLSNNGSVLAFRDTAGGREVVVRRGNGRIEVVTVSP